MIWATERSHCVTLYGFSEFIEPVNNIGYTMVLVIICPSLPVIIGPLLPVIICPLLPVIIGPLLSMIIGPSVPMIIWPLLPMIQLNIPVKTRPKTCFLDRKWGRYSCVTICKICQWLFANDYLPMVIWPLLPMIIWLMVIWPLLPISICCLLMSLLKLCYRQPAILRFLVSLLDTSSSLSLGDSYDSLCIRLP